MTMLDYRNLRAVDSEAIRNSLYAGELSLSYANDATQALRQAVWTDLEAELGATGPVREAQFRLSEEEFFAVVGQLRKRFYTDTRFHRLVAAVLDAAGFDAGEHAFDPLRLRVVMHKGEENPNARPIYYGHRDTWYGNSQSMITWWIPLHDVVPEETFEFFPDDYLRPVHNDSEVFDFDRWVADGQERRIGWQNRESGRIERYPQLLEEPQGRVVPVACSAGDLLLFSAQHLHRTRANQTGLTRFSIDFRTVHLDDDRQGRGAPNVDNRSNGSSLVQFVRMRRDKAGGSESGVSLHA